MVFVLITALIWAGEQTKTTQNKQAATGTDTQAGGPVDQTGQAIKGDFPDADKDGIPNCQDPDWNRPRNGTGYQYGRRPTDQNRAGTAGCWRETHPYPYGCMRGAGRGPDMRSGRCNRMGRGFGWRG